MGEQDLILGGYYNFTDSWEAVKPEKLTKCRGDN